MVPDTMQATTLEITPMQGTLQETTAATNADDHLVLAAKADRKHFGALYTKYHDPVARFVYQRTSAKDEALDITQQVFMQAMIALDKYESRGFPFSSWLYRIALNEINSRYRKTKNQRVINIDETSIQSVMAEINEPVSEEKEELLMVAMQELDEDEVQLLEMRFFEKRPFKEIAEIKDSNESAVKMKVYRLLEKMKGIMEKK
ncbi:MAG: rpoE [Bacteroidetes bacterium]|nr:rpoE [Bacteroidota bacterium]